jgi:TetR/AcrR family fatty acid metabolism transcriptional regulator
LILVSMSASAIYEISFMTEQLKTSSRQRKKQNGADRAESGEASASISAGRDDRRKQILRAAAKVFAEQGYHGARISDVAEEAGVAYGLVYHYFGNKEGLLRSIFETNWQVFAKAIEQIASSDVATSEKVRQSIDFIVNAFEVAPLVVKVLVLEFGRSSRLGDALDEPEVDRVFRAVLSIFKSAVRNGELRPSVDPWALTITFLGALESALASFVLPVGDVRQPETDTLTAMRETLLATFTSGIFVSGDHKPARPPEPTARQVRRPRA